MLNFSSGLSGFKSPFHKRLVSKVFSPASLFAGGRDGFWYSRANIGTLFQNADGTNPVTAAGQLDALKLDLSGNGNHATQVTGSFTSRYQINPARSEYDGIDDASATTFKPTLVGSLAVLMTPTTLGEIALGAGLQAGGRCYLATSPEGQLAAGIANENFGQIKGATNVLGTRVGGVVTWDGTTVKLYQDGAEVHSQPQLGAVDTSQFIYEGAWNQNGSAAFHFEGGVSESLGIDKVLTHEEITNLTTYWSNTYD
jgi:hypothetical protein